jgi:hypothetical protein
LAGWQEAIDWLLACAAKKNPFSVAAMTQDLIAQVQAVCEHVGDYRPVKERLAP